MREVTTDTTYIERIILKYYEDIHVNLMDMNKFL